MTRDSYVLVTAAYNEEAHIADTLRSVANQSALPCRWVIVSDGSTDRTDEIVLEWAKHHQFIEFVKRISRIGKDRRCMKNKIAAIGNPDQRRLLEHVSRPVLYRQAAQRDGVTAGPK